MSPVLLNYGVAMLNCETNVNIENTYFNSGINVHQNVQKEYSLLWGIVVSLCGRNSLKLTYTTEEPGNRFLSQLICPL